MPLVLQFTPMIYIQYTYFYFQATLLEIKTPWIL